MTQYRFEVTPELARAAAEPLSRALWIQNERQYAASRLARFRPKLRGFGVLACTAGVVLSWIGWAGSRRDGDLWVGYAALFAILLVVFAVQPALAPPLRRLTRRLLGARARRIMEQVARKAPYEIDYALDHGVLLAQVEKFRFSLPLELGTVSVAVVAPDFICAFPRPYSTARFRVVYASGAAERAALIDALRAGGATLLEVP